MKNLQESYGKIERRARLLNLYKGLETKICAKARDDFLTFVKWVNPSFIIGKHHKLLAKKLEAVERGEIKRLMISLPPGHSKTLLCSIYFPAWYFGRHPSKYVMSISHSTSLAEDWGRYVRNLIETDEYQRVFPDLHISPDSRSAGRWHTNSGGLFRAAGVGAGISGKRAHIGVIDDAISEQDAYSKAAKEKVNNWYHSGFTSRLMPNGAVIIIMTRWAEDDLIGYLLKQAKMTGTEWEYIKLPAILDEESAALLGANPGEALWPEFWPMEVLLEKRDGGMPSFEWESLYMQNPIARDGGILKADYWKPWQHDTAPKLDMVVQSWDTAFSTRTTADFSVCTTWGIFTDEDTKLKHTILLSLFKNRLDFPDLRRKAKELYDKWSPDVVIVERKASGQSIIQELRRVGIPIYEYNPDRDKIARAHAAAPLLEAGRVWVPEGKRYSEEVIMECAAFPRGAHDDIVDSVTQALLWLRDVGRTYTDDDAYNEEDEDEDKPVKRSRVGYGHL